MSRRTIIINRIDVIGYIWMPGDVLCAQSRDVSGYDIENMKDEQGNITRESVERWVLCNSGDFSRVIDFRADLGDNPLIDWTNGEESDIAFCGAMFSEEE